jgi:S-formylglutathione hydrolase
MTDYRIESKTLETDLVPSPVQYDVLIPSSAQRLIESGQTVPLVIALHGGDGGIQFTELLGAPAQFAWSGNLLPPCIIAAPKSGRSFWVDTHDGTARWESFVLGPWLDELRDSLPVDTSRDNFALFGISMGGMGALRMAFKHPERFAAVATLEPGVDLGTGWSNIDRTRTWFRDDVLYEQFFGSPVDEEYFDEHHPPAIALGNRQRIAASGIDILIECGDEDSLHLHEAAEFLHRLLWDHGIKHEYHLVRGADHAGRSLYWRCIDALEFLGRALRDDGPDPHVEALRQLRSRGGSFSDLAETLLDGAES